MSQAVIVAWFVMGISGCAGGASIHIIPLSAKRMSTTEPLVVRVEPHKCYYGLNDRGELCIAMRATKRSMFGATHERDFALSLLLPSPPASTARQYRVDRRVLRMREDAGYTHTRAASLAGIVSVWDYEGKALHGRFRLTAKRQSYSVLTSWSGGTTVLVVGEFTAVHDPSRIEPIRTHTEEGSMARPPAQQ